jgi:hypothetical protein
MKNPYFSIGTRNEQLLFQNLVDEQIKVYGIDIYYLPRKYINIDTVFKDVIDSKFNDAYIIEAYVNTFTGFQGQGDFMSKFGLKQADELTLTISRQRFEDFLSVFLSADPQVILPTRPEEGDLIYFPLSKNFFEIKFVEHEDPFYQIGKNYSYKLQCELYEYENEVIDTGVKEIDQSVVDQGYEIKYTMGTGTSNYIFGENIVGIGTTYGVGVTSGVVMKWDAPSKVLSISHISGNFKVGQILVGQTSGTGRSIISFDSLSSTGGVLGDNRAIENAADSVLDFSETNPFGEYGDIGGSF